MACIPRVFVRLLLLFGLAVVSVPAAAQYSCNASGGGSINFLVYNPASGTPALASTDVTLTCNYLSGGAQKIDWTMVLSNGSSGNCNARAMLGPGSSLNYNIYQGSIAGGVWGNLGCATYPAGQLKVGPGAGNGTDLATRTLYGQIPTGQFISAGTYAETLTVTLSF